jgi:hypothetical protein
MIQQRRSSSFMSPWVVKNVGQFGRCKTTVLSDPNSCPLTDCHPGAGFHQEICVGMGSCIG